MSSPLLRLLVTLFSAALLSAVSSSILVERAHAASLIRLSDGRLQLTALGERMFFREEDAKNIGIFWPPYPCKPPRIEPYLSDWLNNPEVAECLNRNIPDEFVPYGKKSLILQISFAFVDGQLYPGPGIGTVSDDGNISLKANTRVLNTGAGNDTVTVNTSQRTTPPIATVIDGGAGTNTLSYIESGTPLNVTLQNEGAWNFRFAINIGTKPATDYAYNFQTLNLSGNGDTVQWSSNLLPKDIGSSGAITIHETPSSPDAINTVDFSQDAGDFTFNNGAVDGSPITFTGFTTLIGSNDGNDVFNISPSSGSSFDRYIGGTSNNTFNVNYTSPNSSPLLLVGDAEGGNTFNFTNADQAGFTVVWGGAGSNTYNFQADGSANLNVIELNMAGVTADNLKNLDLSKLELYVDSKYDVGFNPDGINNGQRPYTIGGAPPVVILNATATDSISYNGNKAVSPQLTLTSETQQLSTTTTSVDVGDPTKNPPIYLNGTTSEQSDTLVGGDLTPTLYQLPIYSSADSSDFYTAYPSGFDAQTAPGFLSLALQGVTPGATTVDQTAAILSANISVLAPSGHTVTENFADGSQTVLAFGTAGDVVSRALTLYADNISVTSSGTGDATILYGDGVIANLSGSASEVAMFGDSGAAIDSGTGNAVVIGGSQPPLPRWATTTPSSLKPEARSFQLPVTATCCRMAWATTRFPRPAATTPLPSQAVPAPTWSTRLPATIPIRSPWAEGSTTISSGLRNPAMILSSP